MSDDSTTLSLRALQEGFWALISAPTGVAAAAAELPQHAPVLAAIRTDLHGSAVERLDLYANMYFYRLRDNLALDFAKLREALGEASFHNLVTDYLLACPSQQPSARYVGERLAGFLQTHALAREAPWLSELAALEWARTHVSDRRDQPPLTVADVQSAAADGFASLWLRVLDAHALVEVAHTIDDSWRELQAQPPWRAPSKCAARALLVWRQPDLHVYHRPLDETERALWPRLCEGLSFVALCELLLAEAEPAAAAQHAVSRLASWVHEGLLVAGG